MSKRMLYLCLVYSGQEPDDELWFSCYMPSPQTVDVVSARRR